VNDDRLISVILPCRNQADHIGEILPRFLTPLERLGIPFELIVVPNASTDGTEEVVAEIAREEPRIRVVSNSVGGWGLSVRTGLDFAVGTTLAYTNTARTDPAILPQFLEQFFASAVGLLKARRVARHAPLREIGSAFYNLEARTLFGLRCHDVNGTPKVFSRDFYRAAHPQATGDLLDLELMVRAHRLGLSVEEIPLPGFRRHGGRSSTTLKSAWRMYAGAVRLRITDAA
jgi:glycosyltransferase involved in cell wall biosynthesis